MNRDELLQGLEQIEERWEGKKYSRIELEIFDERYGWMSADDWERFCGLVLAGSDWFPPGKRFDVFYEVHHSEFPKPPRIRVSCDKCKRTGVRVWVKQGSYGDVNRKSTFTTSVARCRCLNGRHWTSYPTMDAVEKQSSWIRWVDVGETDIEACANPHKGREPGEEG